MIQSDGTTEYTDRISAECPKNDIKQPDCKPPVM